MERTTNMLNTDLEQYFKTRQLSDYRTDWPGGEKGCLFLWQREYRGELLNRYLLLIVDFPWRKGATWHDYPKLLPVEEDMLRTEANQKKFWFGGGIEDFNAILVAAIIACKTLSNEDVRALWKLYVQKNTTLTSVSMIWPKMGDVLSYFRFKHRLSDDDKEILSIVWPNPEKRQTSHDDICKLWEPALREWIDSVIHEMTPEKQLFDTQMEFAIDETRDVDVPVRVYDRGEAEYDEGLSVVHLDTLNYWEDGEETYTAEELVICKEGDQLCVKYDVPDYLKRKGCNFEYDENSEELIATEFEEEFAEYYFSRTEEALSYGLTTLIIQYCATAMLLKVCESKEDIQSVLYKLKNYTLSLSLNNVGISIPRHVYEMYFHRYSQRYCDEHKEDGDFICLNKTEQTIACAKAAKIDEQWRIESSEGIYAYLTTEQGERLKKYTENYLKYLDGVIAGLQAIPGSVSYNYFDNAQHNDNSKNVYIKPE